MLQKIDDEYSSSPSSFLQKPTIQRTVHPNCQTLATSYLAELQQDRFFANKILPTLRDGTFGNPHTLTAFPQCSPLSIQHVYHLYLIYRTFGIFLPHDAAHILEVGGGYGNLCRIIHQQKYKGSYTIVDFPLMSSIQHNYLSHHDINQVIFSTLDVDKLTPPTHPSALIATFSVNEMPLASRAQLEPLYLEFEHLLFAYNAKFDGISNRDYFQRLAEYLFPTFEIVNERDKHRSRDNWFMICERRAR